MAIEKISIVERIMEEVLVNERINIDGDVKTIYDVNFNPDTRQVVIQFTDNSVYNVHKDKPIEFVRDVKRPRLRPNGRL